MFKVVVGNVNVVHSLANLLVLFTTVTLVVAKKIETPGNTVYYISTTLTYRRFMNTGYRS